MGRVLPRTRLPRTPLWPQIHRIIPVAWLGIIWTVGCCYVGRASKKSQVVTTQKTNFLYCFFRCSKPRSAEHHPEWPSCRNLRDFAATTWREISRIWLLRTTRSAPCTGQKWIVPSLLQAEPDHFPVFFAFLQKQFKMYPLVIYYIHIENCPFIVDLAIRNGDFPWQTVSLPEGSCWIHLDSSCFSAVPILGKSPAFLLPAFVTPKPHSVNDPGPTPTPDPHPPGMGLKGI